MRSHIVWTVVTISVATVGLFWWLLLRHDGQETRTSTGPKGAILYYQDPSGAPSYSGVPKNDSHGRPFVAVRAPAPSTAPDLTKRHVLYYRNPMGLADSSQVPKKDSMGMDYIPVYADEGSDDPGTVKVSLDRVQRLGVRTARVVRQTVNETVLLSGTIAADERKLGVVALKFQANIVRLHVAATGEAVRKGQPLFDIQSPFLLREELDLSLALRARETSEAEGGVYARTNARSLKTTRERLRLYEVPEPEISRLIESGEPTGRLTWLAPQDGVVVEKQAIAGMQAEPGMTLYRLADLSRVWVIGEAPESALAIVQPGAKARVSFNAFPGKTSEGRVTFVYPEVSMTTRTARVRIELANPDRTLLPGMFASIEITSPPGDPVLAIPQNALIDSGARQVVLVARGEGRFEPRAVTAGRRANGMVEITKGLDGSEEVVTSATFLIDAESNLRAALQSFTKEQLP